MVESTSWDELVIDPSTPVDRIVTPKSITRSWYHTGEPFRHGEYLESYCADIYQPKPSRFRVTTVGPDTSIFSRDRP